MEPDLKICRGVNAHGPCPLVAKYRVGGARQGALTNLLGLAPGVSYACGIHLAQVIKRKLSNPEAVAVVTSIPR